MIKLIKLIKELEKPENLYSPGVNNKDSDDEFIKRGYKTTTKVNPDTGKEESTVEYLPRFEEIRKNILRDRKEVQPFKFSSNPDIAKVAKEANTMMTKLSQMIFALDKMIELERRNR